MPVEFWMWLAVAIALLSLVSSARPRHGGYRGRPVGDVPKGSNPPTGGTGVTYKTTQSIAQTAEKLLDTPTPGQDLTRAFFPLSRVGAEQACPTCAGTGRVRT